MKSSRKVFVLSLALLFFLVCPHAPRSQFDEVRKKYPFGLLGEGYGILTEEDLATNACQAEPEPFPPDDSPFPYWKCFPVQSSRIFCDVTDYDDDIKSDMAIVVFEVRDAEGNHDYLSRRAIEIRECKEFQADFMRLTSGQQKVCVSGSYFRSHQDDTGQTVNTWIFDQFKTKLGCSGFFGLCDWAYQVENGCRLK